MLDATEENDFENTIEVFLIIIMVINLDIWIWLRDFS